MANEARINSNLQIIVGELDYQSRPAAFLADVSVAKGPTPGAVSCATTGTNISFAQLARPALCRIMNLDSTNFVTVGVYDGVSFFPILELLPGESYVMRLSRYLNEEWVGTGTNSDANQVRIQANAAACMVLVEAFES